VVSLASTNFEAGFQGSIRSRAIHERIAELVLEPRLTSAKTTPLPAALVASFDLENGSRWPSQLLPRPRAL
jgi:hypothetical protein